MARILVIDDEVLIRRLLRIALEQEGHQVVDASQGDEALTLHRQAPADLVITDIHMPVRDGLEVIIALRREAPNLRVIAMSGGSPRLKSAALEMAKPLGAFATLQKPFDLEAMLEVVNRALAA